MDLETKRVLSKIQGGFTCMVNDEEYSFASYNEVQKDEKIMDYVIEAISEKDGQIVVMMKIDTTHAPTFDEKEEWVKQHIKQFGTEPSFF